MATMNLKSPPSSIVPAHMRPAADFEPGVQIGLDATVWRRAQVREGVIPGYGCMVTRDFPDAASVVGVPALRVGRVGEAGRPLEADAQDCRCPVRGRACRETGAGTMSLATRPPVDTSSRTPDTGRPWAGWLLLAYLVALSVLVLSARLEDNGIPQVFDAVQPWLGDDVQIPGLWYGHLEAAANLLLFVPIGFLGAGWVPRRAGSLPALRHGVPDWAVWLLATSLSAGVELTQLFLLTERSGTLRDLICNSTGALVGVLAYRIVQSARHRAT